MTRTCKNCRYWNVSGLIPLQTMFDGDGNRVHAWPCQRFPRFEARWARDWCGEFKQKDKEE